MANDAGKPTRRPAVVRLVRVAVAVVVALAALYAVAVNVFLSTSLFTKVVNARPDSVQVQFRSAWSLVPGYVHAENVSIRGRDSSIEWRITLDEAKFRVSFLGLARKRFEASNIHAKGASFRFRQRLDAAPSSPEQVNGLPPIAGFPPYSVRPPKTPKAPSPTVRDDSSAKKYWTIRLESVVAEDVREVWLDHARFEGSARIDGRFYLKPTQAIEVGPAHVAVARGHVSTSKVRVAEALDGSVLDVTLARVDLQAPSADNHRRLSLACDTHVVFPDLARLPLPLPAGMTLRGAVEVRRARLRLDSGVLKQDSQLVAMAPHVDMTSGSHRVRGALALEGGVARVADGALVPARSERGQLTFRAEMTQIEVSRQLKPQAAMNPVLHAAKLVATGDSSVLDLPHFLEDLHVVVEAPDGEVANAQELSRYIPATAPVALLDGDARAELRFEAWAAQKRARGRAVLRASNLHYSLAKMHVRGNVSMSAEFASYHFDTRRLEDATLVIETKDGTLSSATAPGAPLVRMNAGRLRARAGVVDVADPLRNLDVSISMPSAQIASAGLLRDYLPEGSEIGSRSRFSLNCNIAITDHLARGVLDVKTQKLAVNYRDLRLGAQVGVRARVHDWRWTRGELAIDEAKVAVDDLAISKPDAGGKRRVAMSIASMDIGARSSHFRFGEPLAKVTLSVSLMEARVRDFSAMNAFLPQNATFGFEGKDATFGAGLDIDIQDHSGTGTVRVTASNLGAGNRRMHLRGNVAELFADFADWSFRDHTMTLRDSRVQLTRVAGRFGAADGPPQVSAKRLFLSTSAPKFDLARPGLKGSDFRFVFEEGELPDARALAAIFPPDSVVGIDSGVANVAADVTLSHSLRAANGSIEVALRRGRVRLHETQLSGDIRFLTRISGFDPERRMLDLSGTRLEMRNIGVTGATATTSHWRGDVVLSRASLRLGPTRLFDGDVRIDARDGRPLLALVFGNHLPKFVVNLMDMPRLLASMRVIAGHDQLAVVDLDAGGGDLALRGSYAVRGGHVRGGVIAKKAFLSVGFKLDDEGAHLRLFDLEGWLRDQNCAVSAKLQKPIASCPLRPLALAPTPAGPNLARTTN